MRHRWLVPAAIIALLFTLQSLRRVGNGPWGVDGSYYMQVARHVADGDGLLTSVCLYDQGLRTLPARTNIYPLWPLVLGTFARVMPLSAAATFVPRLFFIADLVLFYALIARFASPLYASAGVLLLGLNSGFFSSTCYPYTEGLALFCMFAALLLFDVARKSGDALDYAICGIASAAAFLTRSQMLLVGVALFIALIAVRTSIRNTAVFAAAYAATVLPWIVYLTTFVRPFSFRALIAMHSETAGLPQYDQHVQVHGFANYVIDRLHGIVVMFNPFSDLSFVESFGIAALLVPVAAIYAIWRRKWIGGVLAAAIALAGALVCATLLDAHNRFFLEWLFGYRHGLPFILLIVVAIVQFSGRYARLAALAVVAISIGMSVPKVLAFATQQPAEWPSRAESQVSDWLQHNDPNAIVLTTNAQALSVVSRANFRWAACQQTPGEIARVLQLVRTDYVLVYEQEQRCEFVRGLGARATPFAAFGNAPNRVMLLKVRR